MNIRLRIISVISALCFLGSIACFSAVAAEMLDRPSGDEETGYNEQPAEPYNPDPVVPDPITPDPVTVDPQPYEPAPAESTYVDPDPGYYTESTTQEPYYEEPTDYSNDESLPDYNSAYNQLISEGNFPQPDQNTSTAQPVQSTYNYVDNTQQYNQYIQNQYMAQYDDNYIYVPEYEEPTTSLAAVTSKVIDTDELSNDDWNSIMLDLSNVNLENDATQTFNFIKENEEEGDTDMMWLVYLGSALIIMSILLIIFVIVTTTKANSKSQDYYYV